MDTGLLTASPSSLLPLLFPFCPGMYLSLALIFYLLKKNSFIQFIYIYKTATSIHIKKVFAPPDSIMSEAIIEV